MASLDLEKFRLDKDKALLVVVDIQEKLAVAMKKRKKVEKNTSILLKAADVMGIPVIVTEQYSKGLGPTTDAVKKNIKDYKPVEKITFSSCGEDSFVKAVKDSGKTQIILCGMETHVCVWQTCLGLLDSGYIVHLASDASCSRSKDNYLAGVGLMKDAGAVISSTEAVCFQLLVRAGTDEFKKVSKLVK
jgi:nicotinamidase-related amidase